MPIITEQLIETHRTPAGAWNRPQLEALGVGWPPKKGWKDRVIGRSISEENLQAFIKGATAYSPVGDSGQENLSLFGEISGASMAIDGVRVDGATVCESDFEVIIYTDGSCQGNPGIGGWGAVLRKGGHQKTLCGGALQTTNNRMEITAAIMALQALTRSCRVLVYSDSQYVIQGMSRWLRGWKASQWRGADGSPVKNQDLWMQLDDCASRHQVQWMWVRGHAGNAGNEQADALANQGAQQALEQPRCPTLL